MVTRYNAWIDGVSLRDIDPTIAITDIKEASADEAFSIAEFASRDGSRILSRRRTAIRVGISLMVREYDTSRRKAVLAKVCSWASGQVLNVSDRPDQELHVICEQFPSIASSQDWTDVVRIVFAAYERPYWSDKALRTVRFSGRNGTARIMPGGNVRTFLEFSMTGKSGRIVDSLNISANGRTFVFYNLGIGSSDRFELMYDDRNIQCITKNGVSALNKRAADSSDDVYLLPGVSNTIQISADNEADIVLKARGMWL